jgi:hypothetical protein
MNISKGSRQFPSNKLNKLFGSSISNAVSIFFIPTAMPSLLDLVTAQPRVPQKELRAAISESNETEVESCMLDCISRDDTAGLMLLLQHSSIPWTHKINDMDLGQHARQAGHEEMYSALVEEGIRTEFVLQCLGTRFVNEEEVSDDIVTPSNEGYLASKLTYTEDRVVDEAGNAVMMGWETPLMEAHVEVMKVPGRRVLNVGFGMGIIDGLIQAQSPSSHTIVLRTHTD